MIAREDGGLHSLVSGTTLHGSERFGPGRPEPLSYHGPEGPAAQAFEMLPRRTTASVATVGLGAGSLVCYARPGDRFTTTRSTPSSSGSPVTDACSAS